MNIVIVDDSRLTRQVIRKNLGNEFQVQEAENGSQALHLLQTAPADLVLLANTLTDGSGYELCSSVRAMPEGGGVPIFLMGTSLEATDYAAGFEAGASGYLTKPFKKEELLNLLMLLSTRTTFDRGTTVLVVDDSKSIRVILKRTLANAGFDVIEAENGREGLEVMEKNHVDIVSLDFEMPVLDGLGFLEGLRQGRKARIPVLMLTSRSDEAARRRAEVAGVDAFLTKPFQTDQYLKTLVGLLTRAVDYSAYHVFFVDDSAVTRKSLDALLVSRGFQRRGFESGVEVLNHFDGDAGMQAIPDLILLDLLMPGIDGIAVLKNLRSRDRLRQVPVVMISSYGKSSAIVAALSAGANDFIVKPYNDAEVLARINIHLKPKRTP